MKEIYLAVCLLGSSGGTSAMQQNIMGTNNEKAEAEEILAIIAASKITPYIYEAPPLQSPLLSITGIHPIDENQTTSAPSPITPPLIKSIEWTDSYLEQQEKYLEQNIMGKKVQLPSEKILEEILPLFCCSLAKEFGDQKLYPYYIFQSIQQRLHHYKKSLRANKAKMQRLQNRIIETVLSEHPALVEHFSKNYTYKEFHKKFYLNTSFNPPIWDLKEFRDTAPSALYEVVPPLLSTLLSITEDDIQPIDKNQTTSALSPITPPHVLKHNTSTIDPRQIERVKKLLAMFQGKTDFRTDSYSLKNDNGYITEEKFNPTTRRPEKRFFTPDDITDVIFGNSIGDITIITKTSENKINVQPAEHTRAPNSVLTKNSTPTFVSQLPAEIVSSFRNNQIDKNDTENTFFKMINLPPKDVLKNRLESNRFEYFVDKTKIDQQLGSKKLFPAGILQIINFAINDYCKEADRMTTLTMNRRKPQLISLIFEENPGAIQQLKQAGYPVE